MYNRFYKSFTVLFLIFQFSRRFTKIFVFIEFLDVVTKKPLTVYDIAKLL